jgi:hypothetical protein
MPTISSITLANKPARDRGGDGVNDTELEATMIIDLSEDDRRLNLLYRAWVDIYDVDGGTDTYLATFNGRWGNRPSVQVGAHDDWIAGFWMNPGHFRPDGRDKVTLTGRHVIDWTRDRDGARAPRFEQAREGKRDKLNFLPVGMVWPDVGPSVKAGTMLTYGNYGPDKAFGGPFVPA